MRRILSIGLIGLALGLGAASVAQGQAMPSATKSGPASVDWPISDLLNDPPSKAVLAKDLPALLTYDGLDQIKGMSIRQISQFPQANIDATKLAQIQTDLTAAAGGSAASSAPAAAPASSAPPAPQ
ncbi:MAG TPA: hypothetical protein VKU90_13080 [Caulobacteraceae bacterium]|jgi:hypothetical protein|nr:hypothetical protein [Caulobacteraceae bacterium]